MAERPKGVPEHVVPEGDPERAPTVWYDPHRHRAGYFSAGWEFIPVEAPDGFRHGPQGLVPVTAEEDKTDG